MARGGSRSGAGRKKGSTTKRTREIAEQAFSDGITPLEVMLTAMRRHAEANDWDAAAEVAKNAAPYMHPKLAAVEHSGPDGEAIPIHGDIEIRIIDPSR
jgi:hypothetical protein